MPEEQHVASARTAYDATADVYADLVGTEITHGIEAAVDRALLTAFVELVAGGPEGRTADVGCGVGRVAAFLAARGLDVMGIDVSPAMLAVACAAHPGIEFAEGRLTDLPLADGALAGAVCWYSIIHTPPTHLDAASVELARVVAPGGHLLVGFQAGDGDAVVRNEVHGRPVSLTSYRHAPDDVARSLDAVGLTVHTRAWRKPELAHETSPQAFLLARAGRSARKGSAVAQAVENSFAPGPT